MARLRRLAAAGGPAPRELASVLDPIWRDPSQVSAMAARHGLPARDYRKTPWWERFSTFRMDWCRTNGLMNERWPHLIDYERAKAAGISMRSTSRFRLRGRGHDDDLENRLRTQEGLECVNSERRLDTPADAAEPARRNRDRRSRGAQLRGVQVGP